MGSIDQARCKAFSCRARFYLASVIALSATNALVTFTGHAQAVPRRGYLNQTQPRDRLIVDQTPASKRFNLYGDTSAAGYVDRSPADGIDDARAARLHSIAEQFSPILKRNTYVVPHDVWWAFDKAPVLEVDTWIDDVLQRTDSITVDPRTTPASASPTRAGMSPPRLDDDARLAQLVQEFDPERPLRASLPPTARSSTIMFFDLPGADGKSWRAAYEKLGFRNSRIYAHFFIHEDTLTAAPERFLLVVQYWFLYPFNDGPNDHEGDWEHINLQVTTRESATDTTDASAFLSADEIAAMLDGRMPLERMVIRAVDYYFHHLVLTVDYLKPHRGQEHSRFSPTDSASHTWEDHDFASRIVRNRLKAYPAHKDSTYGRIATHPVGYIAGNNKGMDEFRQFFPRFRRAYNRQSGATYPFPATWLLIGPVGATESVSGDQIPPANRAALRDPTAPWTDLITNDDYLVYPKSTIDLLPDWERLVDLVRRDPDARQEWAWVLLPIRWGYPATGTLLAVVPLRDLGTSSPFGPAFTTSWNRIGANAEHPEYKLHALRTPMAPTVPWSVTQNGWGFLNYPIVIAQMYPFYNMMGGHLGSFGIPVLELMGPEWPRTMVPYEPRRMATMGVGVVAQYGGGRFARAMIPAANGDPRFAGLRGSRDEHVSRSTALAPRFWLDLHVGKSYFVENSYSLSQSVVRYSVSNAELGDSATVSGSLTTRQFTGGIRVRLPWIGADTAPSVGGAEHLVSGRLGYGWTRYTLRGMTIDGATSVGPVRGGYNPTLLPSRRSWPNLAYTGLTYEYFSGRSNWLYRHVGYGFRIDAGGILQRLPSHEVGERHDIWVPRGEVSFGLMLGW